MRFDAHNDLGPKIPYHVFNANGEHIPKCIRGDTETGLIERYAFDEKTGYLLSADGTKVKTIVERHPAPLVLKSMGGYPLSDSLDVMPEKQGIDAMKEYKAPPGYPVTQPGQDVDYDAAIDDMLKKFHASYPKVFYPRFGP